MRPQAMPSRLFTVAVSLFLFLFSCTNTLQQEVSSSTPATAEPTSPPVTTSEPTPLPTATSEPTPLPTATSEPTSLPTETSEPSDNGGHRVNFDTADGATLSGTLYGTGTKGVIFSNINQGNETAWQEAPQAVQAVGYVALTYNYQRLGRTAEARAEKMGDLKAAIVFLREQGVQELVLVGASVGGATSVKVAVEEQPAGLVVISSSMRSPGLEITDEALQTIAAPKLFLNSEMDRFGTTPDSERMYEVASEPKTLFFYSGNAHGTQLLNGEHKEALIEQLVTFIVSTLK